MNRKIGASMHSSLDQRLPLPGQLVHVRQRQYLVEGIIPSNEQHDCSVVELSCVDDDNQGAPLTIFWEMERDRRILNGENWAKLSEGRFDAPEIFAAYFHTLRWNCITATDPKLFQSPFRAGIKIEAYQLEPLRKALLMPRVNLFIADDVGLGKTIEAGLIIRELLLRKKAKTIIVAAPPSMVPQWQQELETRFGLTFQIIDRAFIQRMKQERGYGVNPWSTHSRFIISHKLLIDEDYVAPLRDLLGEFESGTILILDEAHHIAPSSGSKYAVDSQLTKAIRDLAPRFEHRLFLSATPHNGHSNSFSALLEILDPQRFCRGVPVTPKNIKDILVRRLKDDLREIQGGFPKRVIREVAISGLTESAPELLLPQLLDQYATARAERLSRENSRTQAASQLVISGLQQRLLSSIEAFAKTLKVHKKSIEKASSAQTASIPQSFDLITSSIDADDDRATLDEQENEHEVESQIANASTFSMGSGDIKKEMELLAQMETLAQQARGKPDAKIKKLIEWIQNQMCPNGKWNNLRLIIFTEWDDTKRYILQQLNAALSETDRAEERLVTFHGGTSTIRREEIKAAFNAPPSENSLRVLVATDAAREGLNLQSQCWNLFHYDVPWNPSRMEQRNGRIDRKLQPSDEVYCHYFFYTQRPEDKILKRVVTKSETIRKELGSLSKVVDSTLAKRLERGFTRADIDSLDNEFETYKLRTEYQKNVEEELESARERSKEINKQLDLLRDQLARSKESINLTDDSFRAAINSALEIQKAPQLRPITLDEGEVKFEFPRLDVKSTTGTSWSELMDSLRVPKKRDEKWGEWRKNSPVRPVIFNDSGLLDNRAVHLHLEHRIVQRLLGRFTAQGFTAHDLSRACFVHSEDSIPRIVLLGRLALFGPNAARLHEEIVTVTAKWKDRTNDSARLQIYGKDAEKKTLSILEDALSSKIKGSANEIVQSKLKISSSKDITDLLPELENRAKETIQEACDLLKKRGLHESSEMIRILEEQRNKIKQNIKGFDDAQGAFAFLNDFDASERKQAQDNRRYWEKRLVSLEKELLDEPKRILDSYEITAKRIEPIGIVYLWPRSG